MSFRVIETLGPPWDEPPPCRHEWSEFFKVELGMVSHVMDYCAPCGSVRVTEKVDGKICHGSPKFKIRKSPTGT